MRVLFVASNIESPGANGGSTHVTEVVSHLREQDDVLLIARHDSTLPQTLAIGVKTPIPGLRRANALRLALRAYPEVKRFAPEVIYERGSSFGLGALLGRALSVPTLMMLLDEHRTRLSLRTASRVIATRADLVPPEFRSKLRLVRWGANTRAFNPEVDGGPLRAQLGIGKEKLVVGYTGGFYSWHGLEELVESAKSLADLPVVFLLVGEGQRRAAIEKLVASAGLTERFVFTGRVPYERVPEYIAACDICVAPFNPARHGHYGRTGEFIYDPLKVFEYMAMAKPVLTLRASNIEAMFQDDRELLLTGPGDPAELSRKLRELLTDPARRKRLGDAARAAVVASYSWSSHANELRGLFREIVAEHAQSRRA
ncbi:MAG TPA: glycosyltransferase family 4 protein [Polyangiales bacterium]|nr:glycosyltransferase family 4 protein [Polyangiales bacterium]